MCQRYDAESDSSKKKKSIYIPLHLHSQTNVIRFIAVNTFAFFLPLKHKANNKNPTSKTISRRSRPGINLLSETIVVCACLQQQQEAVGWQCSGCISWQTLSLKNITAFVITPVHTEVL